MLKQKLMKHIMIYKSIYLFMFSLLVIGIVVGSICIKTLSDIQKNDLINYMNGFFRIINKEDINNSKIYVQLVQNQIKWYIILWLFGMTTFGIIVIPVLLIFKGFFLGFTISFIIDELYGKGILFVLLTIFPQNIVYLITFIFSCVFAIVFSKGKLNNKKMKRKLSIKQYMIFTGFILISFVASIICALYEAYITPIFILLFSNNLF